MRTILIGAVLLAACSRSKPAPATTEDLWKLAPEKATGGFVIDASTGDAVRTTLRLVQTALTQSPTPALADLLKSGLTFEDVYLLSDESMRDGGVDPSGGMGFFSVGEQEAGAMRIVDHALFRTRWNDDGSCEQRGSLSACADTKGLLATMGKPSALADEVRRRPADMRGGLEGKFAVDDGVLDFAVNATRGRAAARVTMNIPGGDLPKLGPLEAHPLIHHVEAAPATGVVVADLRGLVTLAGEAGAAPAELKAFRGDVIAAALRGDTPRLWIRAGIADADAARALLARCEELSALIAAKAIRKGDTCEVAGEEVTLHLRIDGDTFLAETAPGVAAEKGTPEPAIAELLRERWLFAVWGRGLGHTPALLHALTAKVPAGPWWMAHVYEIGFALRVEGDRVELRAELGTAWQEDDAVLARLEPVLARSARGEDTDEALAGIAKEFPNSHVASLRPLGPSGLQVPLMAAAGSLGMYLAFAEGSDD